MSPEFDPSVSNASARTPERWSTLPVAARTYIAELEQFKRSVESRNQQLEALADEAWAARFEDAAVYKVRLLQKAHQVALTKYGALWIDRGSNGGIAAKSPAKTTIHSLSSDILERIFMLIVGPEPPQRAPTTLRPRVYQPKRDGRWLDCRRLASVCCWWEALVLSLCRSSSHVLAPDADGTAQPPRGHAALELERAALSRSLTRVAIYLSPSFVESHADCAAVAAVLPRCRALTELTVSFAAGHRHPRCVLPQAFTDAVAACRGLTSLRVDAHGPPAAPYSSRERARFNMRLGPILTAVAGLKQLYITAYDMRGEGALFAALDQHPALQELHLTDGAVDCGWPRLFGSSVLTLLSIKDFYDCKVAGAGGSFPSGCGQLKELRLDLPSVTLENLEALALVLPRLASTTQLVVAWPYLEPADRRGAVVHAFGEALMRMPSLHTLAVSFSSSCIASDGLFGHLPRCLQLARIIVEMPEEHCSDEEGIWQLDVWTTALASALVECPKLRSLTLCDGSEAACADMLRLLAASRVLQDLTVSGYIGIRSLCTLGITLPNYKALERVTIEEASNLDRLAQSLVENLVAQVPRVTLCFTDHSTREFLAWPS